MYNSDMAAGIAKPKKTHIYLIIIIAVASVAILISTIIIYRNSINAAEESLKLQALGIAASLEPSLQVPNVNKGIFRDIITEASWEGIAFMALYDSNGVTLLHSNENLIGKKIDSQEIKLTASSEKPVYSRMILGTGEEVFVLSYPIHASYAVRVLRLALHPYPSQEIVRHARLQAISIAVAVAAIWVIGFFFVRAVRRAERLSATMAERERLAVIGEMAAVLAHEIRNPLGSIKGFAQYLSEKGPEGKAELGVIVDEAKRLEHLTEDLLLYARPSETRIEKFNLSEAAEDALKSAPDSVQGAKIIMQISEEIEIVSDREKIKQILLNVLTNSAEAVGENGLIEIKAQRMENKIHIIISDNGPGMDEETKSKAFDSFFTTKNKGTGLGLAIVDKLSKALGGTIELMSEPSKGTVFTLTIPLKWIDRNE